MNYVKIIKTGNEAASPMVKRYIIFVKAMNLTVYFAIMKASNDRNQNQSLNFKIHDQAEAIQRSFRSRMKRS